METKMKKNNDRKSGVYEEKMKKFDKI